MILNQDDMKPIYIQIAEWLETEIISENINADEKMYSQYQLADMFTINPATAAKGLNILAEQNILYKKRGLGMFVSVDARERILLTRKEQILKKMVSELVEEAKRLSVTEDELVNMIKEMNKEES
ncbi:GntR family transcriptional regulator [Bacillus alkalicellulosilyticus]|uniref:GntR family transcriptional regulator n=1 Tax=Alkalihalobacterium alkalicellulosilyticum TaxID=1912214 RepID=UPI0014822EAA|nr:GntR family transcriptional regulator [Bacillus alkalicellulosilyticus]